MPLPDKLSSMLEQQWPPRVTQGRRHTSQLFLHSYTPESPNRFEDISPHNDSRGITMKNTSHYKNPESLPPWIYNFTDSFTS